MSRDRSHMLMIRTPEGISFPLNLASPVSRFLAWAIDILCVGAMSVIVGLVLRTFSPISWDLAGALSVLLYFLISIGYPVFTEWRWRGQTIGKRVLRLRVIDAQGLRLHFSQVMIRNLLRFVDSLPLFYFVGGSVCLVSRHSQRLGDLAANTIVIRHSTPSEPDLSQILGGKYNSFREYPHLAARLRQRVSTEEAAILIQAILRRDQMEPVARLDLFARMAGHLKRIVDFPSEATDGLTDEQYVRNVADLLFQKTL